MSEKLDKGWLARELAAAEEEYKRWPEGIRQSFESLELSPPRAALSREEGR